MKSLEQFGENFEKNLMKFWDVSDEIKKKIWGI